MTTEEFLRRLAPLALRDTRHVAREEKFAFLSVFLARRTEVFQTIAMPVAGLLVVLEGTKHVRWAGRDFIYRRGEAFALPAATVVEVVNAPDRQSGVYRALFLGFPEALLEDARRRWSALAAANLPADPTVRIAPSLASAILHTGEALAGAVAVSAEVIEQRLREVLLMLAEAGAAPLRPEARPGAMGDAVRLVIRADPAAPWVTADVARRLHTTEPTLRRHLRREGACFRKILAEERMRAARAVLQGGRGRVAEAAVVGGYASLSHFARRFRAVYGHAPSQAGAFVAKSD